MQPLLIDEFSACACPVTMICNQQVMGNATGFFWKFEERTHFVSNWHVLSGREPRSGQPIDQKYGAVPDRLQILGVTKQNPNEAFRITVPLINEDGTVLWCQHKMFGQKADLAALDLDKILNETEMLRRIPCLNEATQVRDMMSRVGQDVFVLGFPLGLMKTGVFPIWKRASIATEPAFPIDNIPCFLVDTATREGMSGAPVIQRASAYDQCDGGKILAGPQSTQVVGIYSGRYVGELGEAQLGIVWKHELIEEILRNPISGDFVLA